MNIQYRLNEFVIFRLNEVVTGHSGIRGGELGRKEESAKHKENQGLLIIENPTIFPSSPTDIYEKFPMHKIDMERLMEVLSKISPEQREFILDCFDAEWGARKKIAEKYNMSTGAVKKRKWKIMKKQNPFF